MLDSNGTYTESSRAVDGRQVTRRGFLAQTALAAGGMVTAAADAAQSAEEAKKTDTLPALPNPQDLCLVQHRRDDTMQTTRAGWRVPGGTSKVRRWLRIG